MIHYEKYPLHTHQFLERERKNFSSPSTRATLECMSADPPFTAMSTLEMFVRSSPSMSSFDFSCTWDTRSGMFETSPTSATLKMTRTTARIRLQRRARLEKLEPMEIVKHYTDDFHHVLRQFNFLPPSIEPSATGHIVEQIEITKKLIDQGLAYVVNGSVYFDVLKYNEHHNYGILSGRVVEELMESGRKLDSQDEKEKQGRLCALEKSFCPHTSCGGLHRGARDFPAGTSNAR